MTATNSKCLHPGRVLHDEVMKPLGISRNKLARDLDVPVARISAIVSGTRGITADTALRLEKHLGTSAEFWMKLQAAYDVEVARVGSWRNIEPRIRVFKQAASDGDEIIKPDAGAETDVPAAPGLPEVNSDESQPVGPTRTSDAPLDKPSAPELGDSTSVLASESCETERVDSRDFASIGSQNAEKADSNDISSREPTEPEDVGSAEVYLDEPPPLELTCHVDPSEEERASDTKDVTAEEPPPLELTRRVDSPGEEECDPDNGDLTIPAPPPSKRLS